MSNWQTEYDAYKLIAQKIVDEMWAQMKSHLEEAFIQKIISIAAKGFIYSWEREEMLSDIMREEVKRHLQTTFQPIISEIAKEKARKAVERRAKQCKVKFDNFKEMKSESELYS